MLTYYESLNNLLDRVQLAFRESQDQQRAGAAILTPALPALLEDTIDALATFLRIMRLVSIKKTAATDEILSASRQTYNSMPHIMTAVGLQQALAAVEASLRHGDTRDLVNLLSVESIPMGRGSEPDYPIEG